MALSCMDLGQAQQRPVGSRAGPVFYGKCHILENWFEKDRDDLEVKTRSDDQVDVVIKKNNHILATFEYWPGEGWYERDDHYRWPPVEGYRD